MTRPFTEAEVKGAGGLREAYRKRALTDSSELPYWERIKKYGPKKKKGSLLGYKPMKENFRVKREVMAGLFPED